MKKIFFSLLSLIVFLIADAQIKTPAPSPPQTVKQDFGLASIELSYSRPGIKGRKVFGDLVPYKKVWRTGANGATIITFGDEVIIDGTKIPAGRYGLLTIPDKKSWTIIITRQKDVTNPAAYKKDSDIVRVPVAVKSLKDPVESFTIQIANVKSTSCELQLMWDRSAVVLPIKTDIDGRIMASIDDAMKKDKPPYYQAAVYYMENNKDLNKALEWFNKAAEADPKAYWVQHQWANCLAKLGKKSEAKAAAQRSKELAKEANNDDYIRLNDKLLAELSN